MSSFALKTCYRLYNLVSDALSYCTDVTSRLTLWHSFSYVDIGYCIASVCKVREWTGDFIN